MSDKAKKTGSIFILSTYITSIALAITYFFGSEVLASRDDRIETKYVKEQMIDLKKQATNLNDQMGEFIQFSWENRTLIKTLSVRVDSCNKDCED